MTVKNGPKGWKLDTGKKGTRIIFREYQKAIIDVLVEADKPLGSGAVWGAVKAQGHNISRASIIFYMNFLVDDGLAEYYDATGKGGHHKLYRIAKPWSDVREHIADKIIDGLIEGLEIDNDWLLAKWLK